MIQRSLPTTSDPAAPTRHNLPTILTHFVGRAGECAQADARLRDPACRLLTLAGAGGVGKTRLALELAHTLLTASGSARFPQGVWFVSLAALRPGPALQDTLAIAVASALGLALAGDDALAFQVAQYLREKALLLLFDNCEHLPGAAAFIGALLHDAPNVYVLATSRERLHVQGEWLIALDGLTLPPDDLPDSASAAPEWSAIQLFVQRAQMLVPSFTLHAENASAIRQICRSVAGIPLGIELAASWTPLLSCAEIAAEIAHNLDFLADAAPSAAHRQPSLRAVFASSWEWLSADEQQVLRRLAVFRSSFTRAEAAAVAGATLVELAALLNKSLLYRADAAHGDARYGILGPLHQYAAEQLELAGESEALASRHAVFFLNLLAAQERALTGATQHEALGLIAGAIAEVRAAWPWACDHAARDQIAAASQSLFLFFYMRSWFAEGAAAFGAASQALAAHQNSAADTRAWGHTLAREGWFVFHSGRQHAAQALLEHSLTLLRGLNQPAELVFPLNYLAAVLSYLGYDARSDELAHEGLTIAKATGDLHGQAIACNILGQAAYEREDYAAAQAWSYQSMTIEQQTGNRWSAAFSLTNLGKAAYAAGSYAQAQLLLEQSLEIRDLLGDQRGVALCLLRLGDTAVARDDMVVAGARYGQSWVIFQDIGNRWGMAATLINLGRLAWHQRHAQAALRLLAEALRLALETESLPQVRAIFTLCVAVLERAAEHAWAARLAQHATDLHAPMNQLRAPADQLLAWLVAHSVAEPSLAAAISTAQAPPAAPAPAQPRSQPRGDTLAALTARERDVLRLVARGLSDAEVAEQLVISTRTVSTHLTSIYSKLQVKSRSAATRLAIEQQLD